MNAKYDGACRFLGVMLEEEYQYARFVSRRLIAAAKRPGLTAKERRLLVTEAVDLTTTATELAVVVHRWGDYCPMM